MKRKHTHKSLQEIHEDVPADHYDQGISKNLFQKYWHTRRFSEVLKTIDTISVGKFLDVGCHGGLFTKIVTDKLKPKEIYGIDISPTAIKKAKTRVKNGKFIVGDSQKLPYDSNFFDYIVCLEMLEHVDYPEQVMSEIKKVMKKNGTGIILVPTENKLFKIVWFLWTLKFSHWKHAHIQQFTTNSLENLIKKYGFKIISTKTFNLGMLKLIKFKKIK